MKTLTLVGNFVLLGIVGSGILSNGLALETGSKIAQLLIIMVLIMNIVIVSGSTFRMGAVLSGERSDSEKIKKRWSSYLFLKIIAIILNTVLLGIVLIRFNDGSGNLFNLFKSFIIITLVLSTARIAAGRWNRFTGMKRSVLTSGIIVSFLFIATFTIFRILIGNGIKENISIAKKEYPGKAEDALLAYLADSTKSVQDRTQVAVWTLGQIRSRKALPVLNSLYKNDPKGTTCRHNSQLCQYEIHKAIVSIESNWMGAKEKNVFGSWSRLNR